MVIIALGFVFGAWCLQQQAVLPSTVWMLLLSAVVLLVVFLRHQLSQKYTAQTIQHFLLFFCTGLIGFLYAAGVASVRLSDVLPKAWEQQEVEIVGVVTSLPKVNTRSERFRFDVERVITPKAQVPKHIALSYYPSAAWQPTKSIKQTSPSVTFKAGQRWQLSVKLKRPHTTYNPNGYDFEAWALAENVRATGYIRSQHEMRKLADFVWRLQTVIAYCREKVGQRIKQVLTDNKPYAGVIRALVIGDHSQISAQDWDVYLRTGTNHLMSISGLHISMLAGLGFSLIAFFWRRFPQLVLSMPTRKAAIIGGATIGLLYACLAGLSIPTQRTLVMLLALALALLLNKRLAMSRALAIAVLAVLLFDPWAVIASGFWLSFSAVAFIAYSVMNRLNVRHWLVEVAQSQWAVTLGLLPFLILMFGQVSTVSPVANAIAIPIVSLLVVPLSILGAILPIDVVLHGAQKVLAVCMHGLHWLAGLPFATWQQAAPPMWTVLFAIIGMLWILLPRGFPQRWLGFVLLLPMLLAEPTKLSQGEMQVIVLDVGQGLSVVVKTATHVMLYDTGPKYNQEQNAGSKIIAPYLRSQGVKKLDIMVVSHDDNDHSGGAASLLALMPVRTLLSSYKLPESNRMMPTTQSMCFAGQQWTWDKVQFEVLYPNQDSFQDAGVKDNNRSCVIKVTSLYGSILLPGDIEKGAEYRLLENHAKELESDIVIAPHHGSKTSSTNALIRAVGAKQVVFTVGYLNRFNHPKLEIVQRYRTNESTLYRTDADGAVLVDFTALKPIEVKTWRSVHARYWHDGNL